MQRNHLIFSLVTFVLFVIFIFFEMGSPKPTSTRALEIKLTQLQETPENTEIKYGFEIFNNTPIYIGPEGKVGRFSKNKISCKNCHLDSGTRPFGGNLQSTHGNYPQFRERDGALITLADRINQCIERPLYGIALPPESRELKALLMYIKWLGHDQTIGRYNLGDKISYLEDISRPASPEKGKTIYSQHCSSCHGSHGQGLLKKDGKVFEYPPLWGENSYTIGSSMHRVRMAAAFIKFNMPYGVTWKNPILSTKQALDVASYINSQPRPLVDIKNDYPQLKEKPLDYPYGPYSDSFSEKEHQLGPWEKMKTK